MLMQVIITVIMITIFPLLLKIKVKWTADPLLQETGALPECLFQS